jgi:hypothetical protein
VEDARHHEGHFAAHLAWLQKEAAFGHLLGHEQLFQQGFLSRDEWDEVANNGEQQLMQRHKKERGRLRQKPESRRKL